MLRALPLLLVVLTASAGCGDDPPPAETGAATAPPAEAGDAITESDSGSSFTLAPGGETSLRLSSDYVWTDPAVEGDAVELSRVDYLHDPGFSEWLVGAARPGTATITSLGEPACAGEDGCPDQPLRFRVTITVSG